MRFTCVHSSCCVPQVVVRLSDELLSQAVMVVESCRPTLTINLAGARQHWLEGMLRHEIGEVHHSLLFLFSSLSLIQSHTQPHTHFIKLKTQVKFILKPDIG